MYRTKTYKSCYNDNGYVGRIEWISSPGIKSRQGDIKFGFASLNAARKWVNERLKQLKEQP